MPERDCIFPMRNEIKHRKSTIGKEKRRCWLRHRYTQRQKCIVMIWIRGLAKLRIARTTINNGRRLAMANNDIHVVPYHHAINTITPVESWRQVSFHRIWSEERSTIHVKIGQGVRKHGCRYLETKYTDKRLTWGGSTCAEIGSLFISW